MTEWLTLEDIRRICVQLNASAGWTESEPVPEFDTRFPNILESCLATPQQTFDRDFLYPTLIDQAAILFYLLIKNHPFQNGNKRIALTAMLVFLFLNGKYLSLHSDDLYQLTVTIAESDPSEKDHKITEIKEFILRHLIELQRLPYPSALQSSHSNIGVHFSKAFETPIGSFEEIITGDAFGSLTPCACWSTTTLQVTELQHRPLGS